MSAMLASTISAWWLRRNFGDSYRAKALQKRLGRIAIELRIRGLDAEEEPVARRAIERRHVEHRVIRLRQPVERQHAEKGRNRCAQHRALEGHGDEMRPAVERAAADVHGPRDHLRPVLEAVAAQAAEDPTEQDDERQPV